jgi:hypothetical protein
MQTASEGKNRRGDERAWEELSAVCVARNHQIDSVRGRILSAGRTVVQEHRRHVDLQVERRKYGLDGA